LLSTAGVEHRLLGQLLWNTQPNSGKRRTGKGTPKKGGHFPKREGVGPEASAAFRPEIRLAKPPVITVSIGEETLSTTASRVRSENCGESRMQRLDNPLVIDNLWGRSM
jgi:hypothetical protein